MVLSIRGSLDEDLPRRRRCRFADDGQIVAQSINPGVFRVLHPHDQIRIGDERQILQRLPQVTRTYLAGSTRSVNRFGQTHPRLIVHRPSLFPGLKRSVMRSLKVLFTREREKLREGSQRLEGIARLCINQPVCGMNSPMEEDRFKNITLQQMEALIHLIEEGSFTRAAARMGLTQPTLTKHIRNLEEFVGAPVAERKNTGVSLTPEGRILYDYARRITRLREDAREKIANLKADDTGHVFLCASTIPATYILPRVLSLLRKSDPAIRVHIQTGDSEEAIQAILGNQAEMGIIGKVSPDRKLAVEPLWEDHMVLAMPTGHPWAKRATISLDRIAEAPFILREKGSGTRDAFERCLLQQTGRTLSSFNIACEMGSSEAVKEAVLAGLGVSVLSLHAIQREVGQGLLRAVPIEGCAIDRRFHLIYKKQFHLADHHRRFLNTVKQFQI